MTKGQAPKEKLGMLDCLKILALEKIPSWKWKVYRRGKDIANHVSKGISIYSVYRTLITQQYKKTTQPTKKGKVFEWTFLQRIYTNGHKHMKRISAS